MSIYAAGSSIPPRTVTVGTVEFVEAGSYRATDIATGAAVILPGFVVVVPTCAASAGGPGTTTSTATQTASASSSCVSLSS